MTCGLLFFLLIYSITCDIFQDGGSDVSVTKSMSRFSLHQSTNIHVKLADDNKCKDSGIGLILCFLLIALMCIP